MNKTDLIEAVAKDTDLTKAAAGRAVDAVLGNITATLAMGDTVALIGFGTFKTAKRAARQGKNPKTGEAITIPESIVPQFKPGAGLKTAVAGDKK